MRISTCLARTAFAAVAFCQLSAQPIINTKAGTDWIFPGDGGSAINAPLGKLYAVTVDKNDVLYFSDYDSQMVMRLNADGTVTVVAGNGFQFNSGDGGPATHAGVFNPQGLAFDSAGNLYIAESYQHRIRKYSNGVITTYAGSVQGFTGDGGQSVNARLNYPTGLAIDTSGAVYFADTQNGRIRRIGPDGVITTVAGNGKNGFDGDGGPAVNATLNSPEGVAIDGGGNLYIADTLNSRIRKVDSSGNITTVAGAGPGYAGDGGPALNAQLARPKEMFFDAAGNLYIADSFDQVIRRIDTKGVITTVAGSATPGFSGDGDQALKAALGAPNGVAMDSKGNLYIADTLNLRIRKVDPSGIITTVAGNGKFRIAPDNTPAANAFLLQPEDVAMDSAGNLYIADTQTNRVAKVTPAGAPITFAGTGQYGFGGDGGPANKAFLTAPRGLAAAADGSVFIIDSENFRIRKVAPGGTITTVVGNGLPGYTGDNGPSSKAQIQSARGLALDEKGNLYISDQGCHCIRMIDSAGIIRTIAGTGKAGFSGDNGPASAAQLNTPQKLVADGAGGLYIADVNNNRVRKIDAAGRITTVAGNGGLGPGKSGVAVTEDVAAPLGVALDKAGNLYISAYYWGAVHKVTPDGQITVVAGNRQTGFSGDGGPGPLASLWIPNGLTTDAAGNVFVADEYNNRIRVLLAAPPSFKLSTSDLRFSAASGGAKTARQSIAISSTLAGLTFNVTPSTADGGKWLVVDTSSGAAPATFDVYIDPTSLPPGPFQGQLTVTAPGATPASLTVNVSGAAEAPVTAQLWVPDRGVNLTAVQTGPPVQTSIAIQNTGGGSLKFKATSRANWLTLSADSGSAAPNSPYPLMLTASPDGLAPGTYADFVTVASESGTRLDIPVNLSVAQTKPVIVLSETGLFFQTATGSAKPLRQSIAVLNAGVGPMGWSAEKRTLSGGPDWLILSAATGTVTTPYVDSARIEVSVDPTGLAPGDYYGQIKVRAAADNSPQSVTVVLTVLASGQTPGLEVRPTGLLFTGDSATNPSSQDITIYNPGSGPVTLSSRKLADSGGGWLYYGPSNVTIPAGGTVSIAVQPDFSKVAPGLLAGSITLQFDDGTSKNITVTSLVTAASSTAAPKNLEQKFAVPGCTPNFLALQPVQSKMQAIMGQPVSIQLTAADNCQQSITSSTPNASATVSFDNQDSGGSLTYGNGLWSRTWNPQNIRSSVVATVTMFVFLGGGKSIQNQVYIPISLTPPSRPGPLIASGAVASAASLQAGVPVAPGQFISLFGSNLTEAGASPAPNFPTQINDVSVSMGDAPMPLSMASAGQLNLVVPFDIAIDSPQQIVVQRGAALSLPESLTVRATQPAVFTATGSGSGQGLVVSNATGAVADASNPVSAGTDITIMCTGLGRLKASATDAPSSAVAPVTVTIGGQPAAVSFAGLQPASPFIYIVTAKVPDGLPPDNATPLIVTAGSVSSPAVTIAVQ
ncbi:MAG: hypothetical protein ABI822_04120 [Bryobacteraceae bacterium]